MLQSSQNGMGREIVRLQKNIVTIEDEPSIAELLNFVLDAPQLHVTPCYDGTDGLDAVRRLHPSLVIIDVKLPDMSGWQVFDTIRADKSLSQIPIIVLSVTGPESERRHLLRGSSIDFVMNKPFAPRALRRSVEKILGLQIWGEYEPEGEKIS